MIAGQSFGGLAAVHAAHRRPDRFAAALSQSGSFWWPNGPEPEWLTGELSRDAPPRVHLQVGTLEWALRGPTARLRERLGEAGPSTPSSRAATTATAGATSWPRA
ncbi:alpha/beta hydrolase-fold protein [Nonomuraea wenchangensis]|uniref:alpha/beta hydrolase-fold protein n=1 Tax=Nonomuraea wenchangensis TaxID=568860 RepID=UPI0033DD252E